MNGACIVESRPLANLDKFIMEHLKFIPKDWGLTIYCSSANLHIVGGKDYGRKLDIRVLRSPQFSIDDYNKLFKSVDFWDSLKYDRVLIFQTDSMILREGIEEFLEWDYVGAPWKFMSYGGNGGLSLRNPKIMGYLCEHFTFTERNEDVLFCQLMKLHEIGKLAPREVCKQFSCETIFEFGTLGYHAIDNWLSTEQCKLIKNQYIENEDS